MKIVAAACAASIVVVMAASPGLAEKPPPGTAKGIAAAYRQLHCTSGGAFAGDQESPGLHYRGVTCFEKDAGIFAILKYAHSGEARAYWRHHRSKGEYFAYRGHLIVAYVELESAVYRTYSRKPTSDAARTLGARLVQGQA